MNLTSVPAVIALLIILICKRDSLIPAVIVCVLLIAKRRIAKKVETGGHGIQDKDVEKRYKES